MDLSKSCCNSEQTIATGSGCSRLALQLLVLHSDTMDRSTAVTAVTQVFTIPELLENILLQFIATKGLTLATIKRLFRLQRVNHTFKDIMLASPAFRRTMLLDHSSKEHTGTLASNATSPVIPASLTPAGRHLTALRSAILLDISAQSTGAGARRFNPCLMATPTLRIFQPCTIALGNRPLKTHQAPQLAIITPSAPNWDDELCDGELEIQRRGSWRSMQILTGVSEPVNVQLLVKMALSKDAKC